MTDMLPFFLPIHLDGLATVYYNSKRTKIIPDRWGYYEVPVLQLF